jgi:hypothetical protein
MKSPTDFDPEPARPVRARRPPVDNELRPLWDVFDDRSDEIPPRTLTIRHFQDVDHHATISPRIS